MKDGQLEADHCSFVLGEQPGMLCVPNTGLHSSLTIELHSSEHQHFVSTLSTVAEISLNNAVIECTTGPFRDNIIIRIINGGP